MLRKTHQNMLRMYRVNPETHRVVIDIALDRYLDYFHEWDNSAFRKRDLHPELADFLDLCSEEIPIRKKLELSFWIKNRKEEDTEKENVLVASYRNYYEAQLHMVGRNLLRHVKFSLILFLLAVGFIALYFVVSKSEGEHLLSQIMVEGVLIGAWVFTWESFHMIFFETMDPMKRRKELKRFLDAKIGFRLERKS